MADLDTNLSIIEEFTQRLQAAVLGAEETTANHEYWVTGPEDGTIPTPQGQLKTLRGQIADWFAVANQTVSDAIVGFDNEFTQQLTAYDEEFSQYLLNIGFEPPVLYAAGLTVERISQTYVYNGVTYYWTGALPYMTTGSFGTETGWLIAPITGGIEIPAFTFATGGQLIRRTQTVLGVDGEWYYWTGNLPKTIPAASTVTTAGGVGQGLFKLAAGVFPVRPMLTILATATGNVLNSGSFEYGATVPTNNNLLAQLGTGRMYRWAGSLPKVVNINSTPENSGGISPSAWVLIDSAQGVDGSTIIQETPPTSPTRGMRWSRCSDMKSFIWYVDVDGGQWVEDNPSMGGIPIKHNDLLERDEAGAHDAIYRRASTVAEVASGVFEIGARLSLTDRADAPFNIEPIGAYVVNGLDILNAGSGKVAVYSKTAANYGDIRHLGGINSTGDSTLAAKAAISLGYLHLDGVYHVSDEIVLPSYIKVTCVGKSGFKAIAGEWAGKAVVRASAVPINQTPNMSDINQQTREISQVGQLYIDANNLADFGFYGRGISAESEMDFIVARKAKVCAISLLTCWFSSVKTGFFGLESTKNVSIGSPTFGETGDVFVNGLNIPLIASYRTYVDANQAYDQGGTIAAQKASSGVTLGVGFGNFVGTIVSQASYGANLVASKLIGFKVGAAYLENGSTGTPANKTSLLLASDNNDNSTFGIDYVHLDAGQKIRNNSTSLLLSVDTMYRYDNVQTFDTASVASKIYIKNPSFYVTNAYSGLAPSSVVYDRASIEVSTHGQVSTNTPVAQRLRFNWLYRTGANTLKIKLSAPVTTPVSVQLTTNGTSEFFNVTNELTIGLSSNRTDGAYYTISVGATTDPDISATLQIFRRQSNWLGI